MGSCPSTFNASFTPNHDSTANGTASITMKPVDEDAVTIEVVDAKTETKLDSTTNGHHHDTEEKDKSDAKVQPPIVEFVDTCTQKNNELHHTCFFHSAQLPVPKLIVRRGTPFKLNIVLNRSYNQEDDVLCLVFTLKDAKKPSYSQSTQIFLPVVPNANCQSKSSEWRLEEITSEDNTVGIQVTPAANAIIGEWTLEIDSKIKNEQEGVNFRYKVENPITILFNPWCTGDAVFLPDEELLKEYVLCDSGLVWRGSHNCSRPCIWNYAQFDENVLQSCLYILTNVGRLSVVKRADPIWVVRHISAALNARDGRGVLIGNWTGKYKGGQHPTSWSGSRGILQNFYKTKKPARYGQCWVFSGLFTTVCRALGIPSRSVTNYSSAHESHNSLTIDLHFEADGTAAEKLNSDAVWNFHAWSEVWMSRPDLEPGGYGGWQAVDATCQEESDGSFHCGPASVVAIKRGEVLKAFDTQLLFAEVNAEKVYWLYHGDRQPLKLVKKRADEIGVCISTKAVGKFEKEDITNSYKHTSNVTEEREVMLRTLKQCKNVFSRYYMNQDSEDVEFELCLVDDIIIGETFTVELKARSKRQDPSNFVVNVCLRVDSALYTGAIKKLVKKDGFKLELGEGVEQKMTVKLEYKDYERALVEQCAFIVTATAHVEENDYDFCVTDDFRVRMPDISLQVDGDIVQNQPVTVTAFFTNPLPKVLHGGTFVIEGTGFAAPMTVKCKGDIKSGADARVTCRMIPKSSGQKMIAAKFMSKELNDVDGYHEISVKPAPEINSSNEKEGNSHL